MLIRCHRRTPFHLVGAAHPAPWKGREFAEIDLPSLLESVTAAHRAKVEHFVYVGVAHPAPVMKAYIRVREQCEEILAGSGLNLTVLRLWYVLGPGHRRPVVLKRLYWLGERIPATRDGARRLGLVTLDQMIGALGAAVENPAGDQRVIPVEAIIRTPPLSAQTRHRIAEPPGVGQRFVSTDSQRPHPGRS